MRFSDKLAIVTGGGAGLGADYVRGLAKEGQRLSSLNTILYVHAFGDSGQSSPQEFWSRFIKGVPSIFLLQMFPMHYNACQANNAYL